MTVFKEKKKVANKQKKDGSNFNTTLETKHQAKIHELQQSQQVINQKKNEIQTLKNKLEDIKQTIQQSVLENIEVSSQLIHEKISLADTIYDLETLYKRYQESHQLDDYLLKTSPILFSYFNDQTNSSASSNTQTASITSSSHISQNVSQPVIATITAIPNVSQPSLVKNTKKSVMDFFKKKGQSPTVNDMVPPITINNVSNNLLSLSSNAIGCLSVCIQMTDHISLSISNNLEPTIKVEPIMNGPKPLSKSKLLDHYLSIIDKNHVRKVDEVSNEYIEHCSYCQVACIYNMIRSVSICLNFGNEKKVLIDNETPSFKEPPREITYFAYKKINHFNEWLSQFQAKESTDIDETVFDKIHEELKKERYLNLSKLKYNKVRDILKKLNLTKYYEHCHYITNRISGKPAPEINEELQDVLRNMFKEIQGPWLKHCPSTRNNFFSYPYIFYKFFELLGKDEYLPYFRLLKSREKLQEHDEVWKKICEELQWEYIKTV